MWDKLPACNFDFVHNRWQCVFATIWSKIKLKVKNGLISLETCCLDFSALENANNWAPNKFWNWVFWYFRRFPNLFLDWFSKMNMCRRLNYKKENYELSVLFPKSLTKVFTLSYLRFFRTLRFIRDIWLIIVSWSITYVLFFGIIMTDQIDPSAYV